MGPKHPVFEVLQLQGRNLKWLADQIGYSHQYVRLVAQNHQSPGPEFRAQCEAVLGVPERLIFLPERSTVGQPVLPAKPRRTRRIGGLRVTSDT